MAKHAATEPAQVRSHSYPVFVDQPLCFYMSDSADKKQRGRDACTALDTMVRDHLGLSTSSKIIKLAPGTEVDPNTGAVETYDYVRIGVFFSNVTWGELEHYSSVLSGLVTGGTHSVFTHPEQVLPQPSFSVPTADELRTERDAAVTQAAKSTAVLNETGELDADKAQRATDEFRDGHKYSGSGESGGSITPSDSASFSVQQSVDEMKTQGRPLHELF